MTIMVIIIWHKNITPHQEGKSDAQEHDEHAEKT
jgi:hypothetical protein